MIKYVSFSPEDELLNEGNVGSSGVTGGAGSGILPVDIEIPEIGGTN